MPSEKVEVDAAVSWRALVAQWPRFVFTVDSQNRLTPVSRNDEPSDSEPELGREISRLGAPTEDDALRTALEETRAGAKSLTRRFRALAEDGSARCYIASFVPLSDGEVMIVATDVTAEENAKLALEMTERRHRALLAGGRDVALLTSDAGTTLYVSEQVFLLSGYTPTELLGGDPFADVHPDDQQSVAKALEDIRRSQATPVAFEYRALHRSGTYLWIEATGTNLLADSSVSAIVWNLRDVTPTRELLQASERELSERERMAARLRLLAESSHEFADATADSDRLFAVIANRLGHTVGDLCALRALSEDDKMLERGAVYHRDPEIAALAERILVSAPKDVRSGVMGKVAVSGQLLLIPRISTADFIASSVTPEYRALLERLQVGSVMMVPLLCRNRVVAVAALLRSGSDNPYTQDDVHLVQSVAEYAALAIGNARSYESERAARATAAAANSASHRSENAHRILFEASPVPVLVFDLETLGVLAVNDAAVRNYGYSHEELLAMTLADLRRDSERELVKPTVSALGEGDSVGSTWQRRKDGSEFRAEYRSRTLDFAGRRARMAVITDVTARYEAERMRSLVEAIVRSSNDAIVSKTLDATITSWNAAAERLFGYSESEAIGQSITIVIPSELLLDEKVLLDCVAAGERVENYETVRKRKDGSLVHVSISLAPILDASGVVIGASKTARDLTAQQAAAMALRTTEQQLRQAQKMEAVGRLAGGIAHDFNNVLSVILGHSGLLLGELRATDPMREDIADIQIAARRAADLTRQLLMFSRQQVVSPRVLDLNESLAAMDRMVHRLIGEDVDLVSLPGARLGRIHADPGNVDQVILNLVVNARDAMPRGGKLTIETANIELDAEYVREHLGARPGPHVMLAVSDTGCGMDKEIQARIFEPFFTTKGPGKGTGLGLSTVFGIVEQSGGTIWVYSEPGTGTTFKVYFPCVEDELDRESPRSAPSQLGGRETILLVEDQDQVRAVAQGILKRHGYRVLAARRPGDALLICAEHEGRIDLLLTDVVMPQLSGVELAQRVIAIRPEMRVLYMSGYTDDSVVRHGVLESEMAFVQKPFTPQSLAGKVREVLDASERRRPTGRSGA